jgi:Spy/CpxP family protein refolding chaperone
MKKLFLAAALVAGACTFAMTPAGAQGGATGAGTGGGQGTSSAPELQKQGGSSDRMPAKKVKGKKKKKAPK